MASSEVLVLGGGFAGLSCATALAEAGVQVTLLEKKSYLGGRAYSFRDPGTGETVDNGQHLFMGCYRNTRKFLKRIGSESLLRFPRKVRIDYVDAEGGRDVLACPSWLPAPLHLGIGVLKMSGLSWKDKFSLLRLDRHLRGHCLRDVPSSLDAMTVRRWLDDLGLTRRIQERLLDPIALGALNESPERASALGLAQALRDIFYRGAEGSRLGLAAVGLSELYTQQAKTFMENRGSRILVSRKAVVLREDGGRIVEAMTDMGESFKAEKIVSALPPWSLEEVARPAVLHGEWSSLRATPILGIHLWLDRPVMQEPLAALLGTEVHWAFNKTSLWSKPSQGQYLSLVISGAHRHLGSSPQAILALARADMARCFPGFEKAKIRSWSVIKEPFATYTPGCGSDAVRPSFSSPLSNFFYAGDWTQTRLPATIESAVASGHACAEAVLGKSPSVKEVSRDKIR